LQNKSRDLHRKQLEQEIQSEVYQRLLYELQREKPFLKQFRTWRDVGSFMRKGTSKDSGKDEILRPIFAAHSKDKNPRWRTILLGFFWPGLESIHYKKRAWGRDPEDRWQNIVWIFLEVLCRIDVDKRPIGLVSKVFNDTIHRLHDEYRRSSSRAIREIPSEPEELELLAGGAEDIAFSDIDSREEKEKEIQCLRVLVEAGRINEADFLLLLGTKVYGKSISEYARESGLDYQVVRKRRFRVDAAIRPFMEKLR
jgi:hypothetical protein